MWTKICWDYYRAVNLIILDKTIFDAYFNNYSVVLRYDQRERDLTQFRALRNACIQVKTRLFIARTENAFNLGPSRR